MFNGIHSASSAPILAERTIAVDNIELVFCLVANVEKYRDFVPGWIDAKRSKLHFDGDKLSHMTEQTIGIPGVLFARKTFWTQTTIEPYSKITVSEQDRNFHLVWTFEQTEIGGDENSQRGCTVRCEGESTVSNPFMRLLQTTQLDATVKAFEREALRLEERGEFNRCQSLLAALPI